MISEKARLYTIEITLIVFFLLTIIFNNIITRQILSVILLVFMVISVKLIKSDKMELTSNRQIIFLMSGIGIIYVSFIYVLGIFIGFYKSPIELSIWSILNYIIPHVVIIISAELIRKTVLLKENKKSKILMLVSMVMLDIILSTNIRNLSTVSDYYSLIFFVIFASVANNLLYNHIIINYRNFKAIIIYRIIVEIYVYIFPLIPNLFVFLESIIKMVMAYSIYILLDNLYHNKKEIVSSQKTIREKILTTIIYVIIASVVMVVSCRFSVGMLVIGSGSMTGTINKGDIIIYEKYNEKKEIKTGDIVVFAYDNKKIIHRIIEQKVYGEETRYYTKGDANQEKDDGYRKRNDIIGKVKFKIPYIGYFTLWINDLVGGNN